MQLEDESVKQDMVKLIRKFRVKKNKEKNKISTNMLSHAL